MRYYTTEILSAKQELTPEGFLLCRDVPIARTGVQLYAAGEVPVEARDGIVRIERLAEFVFDERTIASFEGKPVTLDHPSEDVTPANWSALAVGVVLNVRRGSGIEDDLLLADLLITDAAAIKLVRDDGLREVSCGYDAGYEQIEPGRGRQTNVVGNHLALVEHGRCGSRCAIGDSMKKIKWIDRLRAAFKARDEDEFKKALEEGVKDAEPEETEEEKKKREKEEADSKTADSLSKVADALNSLATRVADLETHDKRSRDEDETEEEKKKREEEEAEKTGDKRSRDESEDETEEEKKKREEEEKDGKTGDSAALLHLAQDVRARVEILSPGMSVPTFDSASSAKQTRDSLCALKRKALEAAYANPKTRDAVAPLVAGRDLQKLTCDSLHATFIGASEIVRRENNAPTRVTFDGSKAAAGVRSTISDMNRRAAEFWSGK